MLPPLVTCYPINWPCCALKVDFENTSKKVCSPQVKLKADLKQSEKLSLFWLFHWKTFFTCRKMFVLWILNWNLLERTFGFCSLLGIGKILTRALLGHTVIFQIAQSSHFDCCGLDTLFFTSKKDLHLAALPQQLSSTVTVSRNVLLPKYNEDLNQKSGFVCTVTVDRIIIWFPSHWTLVVSFCFKNLQRL